MKPLSFKLDNTTYTIQPEGYTQSNRGFAYARNIDAGYQCMIFVSTRQDTQSIELGTKFLQNFVISYDYSNGAVRLGVNINAPQGTAMVTDQPGTDKDDGKSHKIGLILAILILILVGIIAGAWYLAEKRRA